MDIQDQSRELTSHPKFTNQIFEKEEIYGYDSPHVDIYYTAGSMKYYIQVAYRSKEKDATQILPLLTAKIPKISLMKRELDFIKAADESFQPPLRKIQKEYTHPSGKQTFRIYKGTIDSSDDEVTKLKEYHRSVQFHTLLNIDGASYLDIDDPKWEFFMVFEKVTDDNFHFVGYATMYPFLGLKNGSFKDGLFEKIRISQVLILPRYQGRGTQKTCLLTLSLIVLGSQASWTSSARVQQSLQEREEKPRLASPKKEEKEKKITCRPSLSAPVFFSFFCSHEKVTEVVCLRCYTMIVSVVIAWRLLLKIHRMIFGYCETVPILKIASIRSCLEIK